jgi:glycosyltransferase involved in cell wall biosynthesis
MTEPKVSVVIPTYNRSAYLRQAIDSVLTQSYGAFEIVISDNCSSDDTESIVRGLGEPRIRYFRNTQNIGMVPNWNAGIRRARGKYIAILEDDNRWHPRYLERAVQTLDAHPQVAFVHTAVFLTDQDGRSSLLKKRWDEDRLCDGLSELRELMHGNRIFLSTVTSRRDCLHSVGLFDEAIPYAADWEMWLRLYLRYPAAYLAEPLASYRIHEGSGTARLHSQAFSLFCEHRKVIRKTVRNIRAAHGKHLARELGRSWYRWLAEDELHRAWGSHKAGKLALARREAALAVRCAPEVVLRFPLRVLSICLTAILPERVGQSLLTFEERVGRPLLRYLRSNFRGMP